MNSVLKCSHYFAIVMVTKVCQVDRHLKNLTHTLGKEDQTVGERQKISIYKPDVEGRTVGRQQKNRF